MPLSFPHDHRRPNQRLRLETVICLLCWGAAFGSGLPVCHAQPASLSPDQVADQVWEKVQAEIDKQKKKDPQAALLLIEDFLQAHPKTDALLRNAILQEQVEILTNNLKDHKRALAMADEVLQNAQAHVQAGAPEYLLVKAQSSKARVLLNLGQMDKTEALLDTPDNWERMLRLIETDNRIQLIAVSTALNQLLSSLREQGKSDLESQKILEVMGKSPWTMVERSADLTRQTNLLKRLAPSLIKARQTDEALSWAKYVYMQADFSERDIENSTKALTSAWATKGDLVAIRDFGAAQAASPAATFPDPINPLAKIALPPLVASNQEALRAMIEPMAKSRNPNRQHHLISLYIALGDWVGAMETARELWRADPRSAKGAAEVCRVFKAADLSTARANHFLAYLAYLEGNGVGANPIDAFLQEKQAKTQG